MSKYEHKIIIEKASSEAPLLETFSKPPFPSPTTWTFTKLFIKCPLVSGFSNYLIDPFFLRSNEFSPERRRAK